MKKRILASFIFLSSFSVLAAACGGNTKTQTSQTSKTTAVKKEEPKKVAPKPPVVAKPAPKPCVSTVSLVPKDANHLKKVYHICLKPTNEGGGSFTLKVKD